MIFLCIDHYAQVSSAQRSEISMTYTLVTGRNLLGIISIVNMTQSM